MPIKEKPNSAAATRSDQGVYRGVVYPAQPEQEDWEKGSAEDGGEEAYLGLKGLFLDCFIHAVLVGGNLELFEIFAAGKRHGVVRITPTAIARKVVPRSPRENRRC